MATIDLNNLFPVPDNAEMERGALPKQQLFLDNVLDIQGPKYTRYVGGIGSGKTLIGCITMLCMAIQHSGDYLIARQYYPELRDTTYRQFLEICPPELIHKHKIAETTIQIKAADGGISTVLFRPLEEPDKLRSLNLNAFYIDEANQVSKEAFLLLQGRLRGRHWRKGFITQNSGGHDWSWKWFVKQDHFKGVEVKKQFFNIIAPTTENVFLPDGYVQTMMDTWSHDRIQREILANEDSFEGQIYPEFREDVHVIRPFAIPHDWVRVVGIDHGHRNPAAWIFGAMDGDGTLYIYREFYKSGWDVKELCLGKKVSKDGTTKMEKGIVPIGRKEKYEVMAIDPSTSAESGGKGGSLYSQYIENTPRSWPLVLANNKVLAGIDRVKQQLRVHPRYGKPNMFVFDVCKNLINELSTYRWAIQPARKAGKENEKEKPQKVNDHAVDALRYLVMTRPEPYKDQDSWYDRTQHDYNSLESRLHRDLEQIKGPKRDDQDPFGTNT